MVSYISKKQQLLTMERTLLSLHKDSDEYEDLIWDYGFLRDEVESDYENLKTILSIMLNHKIKRTKHDWIYVPVPRKIYDNKKISKSQRVLNRMIYKGSFIPCKDLLKKEGKIMDSFIIENE
jgi:hypothetical protein